MQVAIDTINRRLAAIDGYLRRCLATPLFGSVKLMVELSRLISQVNLVIVKVNLKL
jgi:hypothetical protein